MKLCPTCRTKYPDDANFCPQETCATPAGPQRLDPIVDAPAARFELGERIGGGASGEVWQARDTQGGGEVAYKIAAAAALPTAAAIDRAQRELKQLSRAQSDKIAKLIDHGKTADGRLFVVTELCAGEALDRVIASAGAMPLDRAQAIIAQVGEALLEGQKVGVVHHDVATKNLLLGPGDKIKVINFAVPRPVTDKVFGMPEFLSPEQAEGKPVDQRSNTYSLGTVLYTLLTGAPPFAGGEARDVIDRQLHKEPEPPSRRNPNGGISAETDRIVLKALEKSSSRRHLTLRQFLTDVEGLTAAGKPAQAATSGGATRDVGFAKTMMFAGGAADVANLVAQATATRAAAVAAPAAAAGAGIAPAGAAAVAAAPVAPAPSPPPSTPPPVPVAPARVPAAVAATLVASPAALQVAHGMAPPAAATTPPVPVAPPLAATPPPLSLAAAPPPVVTPPAAAAPAAPGPSPGPSPHRLTSPPPLSGEPPTRKEEAQVADNSNKPGDKPGAAPAKGGKPGAFRETLWFKKGDVEQMVAEAKAKAAAAKGGKPDAGEAEIPGEDARPLEDRYADDGSVSLDDRKKFSLRTGGTATAMPAVGASIPGERMSESEMLNEIGGGKKTIILIGAVVVAVVVILVLVMSGGKKEEGGGGSAEKKAAAAGAVPAAAPSTEPAPGGKAGAAAGAPTSPAGAVPTAAAPAAAAGGGKPAATKPLSGAAAAKPRAAAFRKGGKSSKKKQR